MEKERNPRTCFEIIFVQNLVALHSGIIYNILKEVQRSKSK